MRPVHSPLFRREQSIRPAQNIRNDQAYYPAMLGANTADIRLVDGFPMDVCVTMYDNDRLCAG